ncbi:Ff.00g057100.m01.CDS01 [Fusarium sp. VM40]|nr:Ff.00g057100.m01.CDS01 [Fusarium sp. VM40]
MAICASCRFALRRTITTHPTKPMAARSITTSPSTAASILEKPTWSVRSLLPSSQSSVPAEKITPKQLHHLLRLSALPLPTTPADETAMINTLESQLQFVRAVQSVDTTGVEPLRAIRDETPEARQEVTIGLEELQEALGKEVRIGHYQRARRVREKIESNAEKWDALGTAGKTAGRYFVVESGKKDVEGGE